MDTLQNIYRSKKEKDLFEKVKRAEKIIKEQKEFYLILEAIDPGKLQEISKLIQRIEQLVSPFRTQLPELADAADTAIVDMRKEIEPSLRRDIGKGLKNLVGLALPISKVIGFIGSLKQGFSQIPQIIDIIKKQGNIDKTKPMSELLGGNQAQAEKILQNSFAPPGFLSFLKGAVGKSNIPYVKNANQMTKEILQLSFDTLSRFSHDMAALQVPISAPDAQKIADVAKKEPEEEKPGAEEKPETEEKPKKAPPRAAEEEIKTIAQLEDRISKLAFNALSDQIKTKIPNNEKQYVSRFISKTVSGIVQKVIKSAETNK